VQVRVLGAVEVVDGGTAQVIGSPSQRTVLAVLAARVGQVVPADTIIDALWGDDPPPTATRTLRSYVSRLRRVVGPRLVSRAGGYILDLEPAQVDAHRFDQLIERGGVADLEEALALWGGPPYAGLEDVELLSGEIRRLQQGRGAAREEYAAALAAAGRATDAIAVAEALVADDPYRERAWATLVTALVAAGRPADALRSFQHARRLLAEVGLEPSEGLRRAEQAALGGEDADPGAPAVGPMPPAPATSLVGREVDLRRIAALLDTARVVTLVGPGGVGKTRLAVEAARAHAGRHVMGARLVELARAVNAEAVESALVDALGLVAGPGSSGSVLARAGQLDVLLVVDNCEHVVDEVARLVQMMLAGGPRLVVLATSRERLGVEGEHSWVVAPLPAGGPTSSAHRLFADRAAAAGVRSELEADADAEAVERIVTRLDGLPLAIEMAATRAATMGVADLADRLDDRLDGLRSALRHGDPRHRTLAAVIEWSEALLDADDRAALADMSVFAGPVTAEDLAGVLGPGALDRVQRLAERSLVVVEPAASPTLYGMLGTVRDHAAARLADAGRGGELAARHARWFVDVVRRADADLFGPGELAAHERIDTVFAELRRAHGWARRNDPALGVELSVGLHQFARSRQRVEPFDWAAQLASSLAGEPMAAPLHAALAHWYNDLGDLGRARASAQLGMALAPDDPSVAITATDALSDLAMYSGELTESIRLGLELADLGDRVGDRYAAVIGVVNAALAHAYGGRPDEAARLLAAIDRDDLGRSLRGWLLYGDAEVALDRDPAVAVACFEQTISLADSVGNRFLAGVARVSLTALQARAGDAGEALRSFEAVVEHWWRQGNRTHQITTLRNLVGLFERVDAHDAAAELLGAVGPDSHVPTYGEEADLLARAAARLEAVMGADRLADAVARGAGRDIEAAAVAALEEVRRLLA
jgi:predicted ATPase/DNA-binding SARP family transcriptional activator